MALSTSFYHSHKLTGKQRISSKGDGFTLIELIIVVAVIAIILTLALPVWGDYLIRSKVSEALNISNAAKTAVSSTCQEDPLITALTPQNSGYSFTAPTQYIASINLSGPCTRSVITVITQSTGASPDPTLSITGTLENGHMRFVCVSSGPNKHVPKTCRS